MAVSAWITIPLGPVPFTLQVFAMVFAVLLLKPAEAISSVSIYLLMGAIGLPIFSSMRGGIGVLAGPTGGFLWGWLLGALMVALVAKLSKFDWKNHRLGWDIVLSMLFMLVTYACGWIQLAVVAQMGMLAAFMAAIAPFVVVDAIKLALAIAVARAVRRAVF